MAYNDIETSIEGGSPFYLYEFTSGTKVFRYTDQAEDVDHLGESWKALSITHSEPTQTKELTKNSAKVTLPLLKEDLFISTFIGWTPDLLTTLVIRRGHYGADDSLVYWSGRVSSHVMQAQKIILTCESVYTSLRRPGASPRYQRTCRHTLYGPGCNLSREDFAVNGEITAIDGLSVTIPDASSYADAYFTGGILQLPDLSYRTVVSHSGGIITLNKESRHILDYALNAGWGRSWGRVWGSYQITLYPGCDRKLATCIGKFDNVLNNGSFRWIPNKNPMGGSSLI